MAQKKKAPAKKGGGKRSAPARRSSGGGSSLGESIRRLVAILVLSVVLALTLLVFMKYRELGPMSELETRGRFAIVIMKGNYLTDLTRAVYAEGEHQRINPPLWFQRAAVVLDAANLPDHWWVPLVLTIVIYVVTGYSRRRARR